MQSCSPAGKGFSGAKRYEAATTTMGTRSAISRIRSEVFQLMPRELSWRTRGGLRTIFTLDGARHPTTAMNAYELLASGLNY